jgi:hypothetical protein
MGARVPEIMNGSLSRHSIVHSWVACQTQSDSYGVFILSQQLVASNGDLMSVPLSPHLLFLVRTVNRRITFLLNYETLENQFEISFFLLPRLHTDCRTGPSCADRLMLCPVAVGKISSIHWLNMGYIEFYFYPVFDFVIPV